MQTKRLVSALATCACLYTGAAHAQADTQGVAGSELLKWCADGSPAGNAACVAYIMGISDAVAAEVAFSCPGNATRAQRREVVMRFLIRQSANTELPAGALVTLALKEA